MKLGASYAEARVEERWGTVLELKNGTLEKAIHGRERGACVRVLVKGRWGFFSTNRLGESLLGGVETAVKLARSGSAAPGEQLRIDERKTANGKRILSPKKDPHGVSVDEKHELLKDMDSRMRAVEGITSATSVYTDGTRSVRMITSSGGDAYSEETRVVAQGVLVAREAADILGYRFRLGHVGGMELFEKEDPLEKSRNAAEAAVRLLHAKRGPAGHFPLIADPELTGVFIHEALGHAAEGDLVATGGSVLSGRIGETLGPENLYVYDDPTYEGGFGSYAFDQEATPTSKKMLIEAGVLRTFLLDRESSAALGIEPNGSARAQDHESRPLVRMSNTYIGEGDMGFDEMVSGVKFGVYAKGTRGGQVDPTKGSFQFGAQEAYLIEGGEITTPLRDVSLSGNILEILMNIDGIGDDMKLGDPGFCGKGGQLVPVGDGGPHIRIARATVGGGG